MSTEISEQLLAEVEQVTRQLQGHFPAEDLGLIERVYAFATKHYAHIVHPILEGYCEYTLHVATVLAELGANPLMIAATILCPPPSVADQILKELEQELKGEQELLELIKEVLHLSHLEWNIWSESLRDKSSGQRETVRKMLLLAINEPRDEDLNQNLPISNHFQKQEKQRENVIRMFLVAAPDVRALIIKLADYLYFTKRLKDLPMKQKEFLHYKLFARITLVIYAPLADRLGMWQLKPELEDAAFRLLQPEKYMEIARSFDQKKQERKDYITHVIIPAIEENLHEDEILQAKIIGRAKHIYSIYQKMEAKQLTFDEINDLLGIRILVNTEEDCYRALSSLHRFWQPVTSIYNGKAGRDWIANPKENKYQSLHTTISFQEKEIEVQIRTYDMHEKAEYGPAIAHWKYKEEKTYRKGKTPQKSSANDQTWNEQLAKLRRSLEEVQGSSTTKEMDLLKKWVFAITPEGHVIDLPAGATTLDFAYRIHTNVGHRYAGAKVGHRLVQLGYEIKNGDIIELKLTHSSRGPRRKWLSKRINEDGSIHYLYAKTDRARSKIQGQLNEIDPDVHTDLIKEERLERIDVERLLHQAGSSKNLNLSSRNLTNIDLTRMNLRGAKLRSTRLISAQLGCAQLSEADLSNSFMNEADLSGAILKGACLDGVNLRGAKLIRAELIEVSLSKAILSKARLNKADLSKAILSEANLTGANLGEAILRGADLSEALLSGAKLAGAILDKAKLQNAILSSATLAGASLKEANLQGATLSGAKLVGTDLSNADLSGARLNGATLVGANISGANLSGARLTKADLSNTNLCKANLSNADLSEAKLQDAQLQGANLRDANLQNVQLQGINLPQYANLDGADLSGTTLRGARVTHEQLAQAKSLQGAIMPDGSKHL